VSFEAITLCVASQPVFIVLSVYFVIDSTRKLLDTPSYASGDNGELRYHSSLGQHPNYVSLNCFNVTTHLSFFAVYVTPIACREVTNHDIK
jgi:hypothetical protein